jgi:hypothetical protein
MNLPKRYKFFLTGIDIEISGYDFTPIKNADETYDDLNSASKEYDNKRWILTNFSDDGQTAYLTHQEGGDLERMFKEDIELMNNFGIPIPVNVERKYSNPTYENSLTKEEFIFWQYNSILMKEEYAKFCAKGHIQTYHYDGRHLLANVLGEVESADYVPSFLAEYMKYMEETYQTGAK